MGLQARLFDTVQVMLEPSPDTYRSVLGLRTVRRFLPDPLSEDDLTAILEAGRWTGSSKNRQSWLFLVVRDRDRLEALAECGDFTQPLRAAAAAIVPIRTPEGYDWDLGRLSQNVMLAAAARGVGSCPITLHREECGRKVLGVPDDHGCKFLIALGYPDEENEAEGRARSPLSGRKPLEGLVRYERF
jgi:nitroreductase